MTEKELNSPAESGSRAESATEDEVSLVDLLLVVARYRRMITWSIGLFAVLGLLIALLSPAEYTSSARVIREAEPEIGLGSIGALSALRGLGISLGGASTGLTPEAFPDITRGREVRLAVVRDTFYFSDEAASMSWVEYLVAQRGVLDAVLEYTIRLPGKLIRLIRPRPEAPLESPDGVYFPSEDEEIAMKEIASLVSTSVDLDTGLMTISATTGDPYLSAELAASFVEHLVARVREILTVKARQNLEFIEERFAEAQEELRDAESRLAVFLDSNADLQRASLRTEQDRLQRAVTFKSQLYSDLQTQLTQAQIELQRSEPVITVLERPTPPLEKSGLGGLAVLIICIVLGGVVGLAMAFIRWSLDNQMASPEDQAKMDEVRAALIPRSFPDWRRWIPGGRRAKASRGGSGPSTG